MNRLHAWCRQIGTLNAWPLWMHRVLRKLACDHSWEFAHAEYNTELVSRFIIRRMTGHVANKRNECFEVIEELYCFACDEVVAICCGMHLVTVRQEMERASFSGIHNSELLLLFDEASENVIPVITVPEGVDIWNTRPK